MEATTNSLEISLRIRTHYRRRFKAHWLQKTSGDNRKGDSFPSPEYD